MDTTADQLKSLRENILEQTIPLLDSGTMPAEERFRLILQIAQNKGSLELYQRAFAIAQTIQEETRLNAYLDLLAEIDGTIQDTSYRAEHEENRSDSE